MNINVLRLTHLICATFLISCQDDGLTRKDNKKCNSFDVLENTIPIESDGIKYFVSWKTEVSVDPFIVLRDSNCNTLDTFFINVCRSYYLAKGDGGFVDLTESLRSTGSETVIKTRLAVVENQLLPIYTSTLFQESSWVNYSKDSTLRVISRNEVLNNQTIFHEIGVGLPSDLRLLSVSLESEIDTLNRVLHADTTATTIWLKRDLKSGVYMERYLTNYEKSKTGVTLALDSVPYLNGMFYNRGQWCYFPAFE
ncbi:MAG: hypothetical protein RLZZ262_1887 [Bacteroidota bacterium]